jgi:hypothetical protein
LNPVAQRERFDVAVVGGGFAGIAAALSAAQLGAHTLLVERSDVLGGNASNAFVHSVCGLYLAASEGDAKPANPGFPQRFATALRAGGAAGEPERAGKVWVLPTEPQRIPDVAAQLCFESKPLRVRLVTQLCALTLGDGAAPQRLTLATTAAQESVEATIVIDTSGDAAAGAMAGAAVESVAPESLQLPSYIFRLEGVAAAALEGFARLRVSHAVAGGVRDGGLPRGCESVLVRPGGTPGSAYVTLNLPRPQAEAYAPLDPAQTSQLESSARQHAECVTEFLRARPEFANCRIDAWPRRLGIREARRLIGRETLDREHVLAAGEHPDAVARSSWPIELWHDHRRASFEYPKAACDIALGALISASHPRLGVAGRCLSASHEALGALRVLGTALASGEAIGVAAALAADAQAGLPAIAASDVRTHIQEHAAMGASA